MGEDLRIDSHKLIYHPQRVANWLAGENIYPLTVEISPSGACNHRCCFCAFDYLGYKSAFLEKKVIVTALKDMARCGVKAIVVAGEGEPLLNEGTVDIINETKVLGMDVALVSNGVLFSEEVAKVVLPSLSWARFSINAGTSKTHKLIHNGKDDDFEKILSNLENAVKIKKERNLSVTIGVQLLLIAENMNETVEFAKLLKQIGVDYYTIKPYSKHPKSINEAGVNVDYKNFLEMEIGLEELRTNEFQIYFRAHSMKKKCDKRRYDLCRGLPFWAYIDSQGNVWACIAYVGDERFYYGNISKNTFEEVWSGERRFNVNEYVENMSIQNCRELCRLDEINKYLHELKNPIRHVNFI